MGTVKQELTITIDDVVNAKDDAGLTRVLREAAEQCGYYTTLDVSFDYWHFGRHAEHAQHNGMLELAALFSAAWQVQYRVLMHSGRSKKVRDLVTQEQAAIRLGTNSASSEESWRAKGWPTVRSLRWRRSVKC